MDKTTERLAHLLKEAQAEFSERHLVIAIPGFLSKKFIGYCSMKEDLELSLEYIKLLRSRPEKIIRSALTFSLISLYSKCFTDASKNNYPKLEPHNLFKDEIDYQKTHDFLIDLRNQFIAHRGKTEHEVGIAYIAMPKEDQGEKTQLRFSQLKKTSFSDEDLNNIEPLIQFVIKILLEKIQKSGQKVHDTMLNLFTTEQLTMMMINNMK